MAQDYFDTVDPKQDFPSLERQTSLYWDSQSVVAKYLAKNKTAKKHFSFLDGPITANNPMGVHHAWGRTYKDLWQKYKNMQGFKQRFQNGFDAQGLWVEVEVEKELGFKTKKDIEKFGIEKFVNLCRERVKKYSDIQTEQSKRLGYFMDWDHSYYTLSEDNNYMIWQFLQKCHANGWLYKGNDSVPWCPRCETAISQHEILTEDYRELEHESIVLAFPITQPSADQYLLVWTTTPWTIPANIAIAVDANLDYALVENKDNNKKYWLAKDALKRVFKKEPNIVKVVKGKDLVGLKYSGPFDDLPAVKKVLGENAEKFHTVVATDDRLMPINTEEGTGLVHTAVSAGTEDFKLGIKLGLPMIPVIEDDASYMPGFGQFSGKNAKDNPRLILDYLENEKSEWVFSIFAYKHRYPGCWRCKTELVWKVTDEWYISMDKPTKLDKSTQKRQEGYTLRTRMIKVAKQIGWLPSFGLKRELDWLKNMDDWLISKKNRYWGLALPIWECKKCGHFEVFGSKAELQARAVEGWNKFDNKTPHKPQIDEVKITCKKCGEKVSRIEPVGNPWLDAGIVPFSTVSDNNCASNFETTKTPPLYMANKKEWLKWYPADFITESFPGQFKNWFYSLIAMSTVLEDSPAFKTVLGFATLLAEDGRPMHKSWGNMIRFDEGAEKIGVDVMRWMYVTHNPADNLLFGYTIADEVRRRFHLILWNVYNFFVTFANSDGWQPESKGREKNSKATLLDKWILAKLNITLEVVTQKLDKYDPYLAAISLEEFVDDLSRWYIRRSRQRVGPAIQGGADKLAFYETCYTVLTNLALALAPFMPFLPDVIYKNLTKKVSVHLADWPIFKTTQADLQLLTEMQLIREIVELGHAKRKEANVPVRQPLALLEVTASYSALKAELIELITAELNVKKVVWKKGPRLSVQFDLKLTPELQEEASTRELIRMIQKARKELGITLGQQVEVSAPWVPQDDVFRKKVIESTLAIDLRQGEFKVKKV